MDLLFGVEGGGSTYALCDLNTSIYGEYTLLHLEQIMVVTHEAVDMVE